MVTEISPTSTEQILGKLEFKTAVADVRKIETNSFSASIKFESVCGAARAIGAQLRLIGI